jgi:hypothetical protein
MAAIGRGRVNSAQPPPPDVPPPGGKAAERLREQLAKEFGDAPPNSPLEDIERVAEEPRKGRAAEPNSPEE